MLDIFKVRITLKACCIVYYTVVHIVLVSPYATTRHINIPMTHNHRRYSTGAENKNKSNNSGNYNALDHNAAH